MVHSSSPGAGREPVSSQFDIGSLTRDQRVAATRIANKFREAAVVQVLTGPCECGKSTVAHAVAHMLEAENQTVLIAKSGDLPPNRKRLMQEAYGSYSYLLAAILKQLGFYVRGEEGDLVDQLVEQIRKLRREEKRILLILDEAEDFQPEVWKRFQSWLDFQDGGIRMFQTLIVGSPEFKSKLTERSMRGWRRWIHARHELALLTWKSIGDEARRVLKQVCETINARSKTSDPVTPPSVSWLAVRRIARESGGRPGRLAELVKRALNASIREGGCRITARFLARADALRAPAIQMYRSRKAKAKTHPSPGGRLSAAGKRSRPLAHPLGWMRYALGFLLVLFVIGAGWGITAWLSIPAGESTLVADSDAETDSEAILEADEEDSSFSTKTSDDPFEYDLTHSLGAFLDQELSPWDETESPWGTDFDDETETLEDSGWDALPEVRVAEEEGSPNPIDVAAEVPFATSETGTAPLEIQMSEAPNAEPERKTQTVEAPVSPTQDKPLGEIRLEQPEPPQNSVAAKPPAPAPKPKLAARKTPNKKILEHLSRMAKALE